MHVSFIVCGYEQCICLYLLLISWCELFVTLNNRNLFPTEEAFLTYESNFYLLINVVIIVSAITWRFILVF